MSDKIGCDSNKYKIISLIVISTLMSLSFKICNFDYLFVDYVEHLSVWIREIRANGYLFALAKPFYNYAPTYMYILVLLAKLDINPLYTIKAVSILFEYIAAFYVGQIAFLLTKNESSKWIPFAIVPLIPSVMFNSALMSQCDAIYVSFLLASIFYLLKGKQIVAMILLGLSLSLKLQAVFVLPFYFVYMLRGHIKWYLFSILPFVYLIIITPVYLVGRSFRSLIKIYISQGNEMVDLTCSFPNIYIYLSDYIESKMYGMVFVALLVVVVGLILKNKKYVFSLKAWIILLFLSAIVCPYFLPGMHERYMYFGDLVAVLYVFTNRKNVLNWIVAIGILYISCYAYADCLNLFLEFYPNDYVPAGIFESLKIFSWNTMAGIFLGLILYVVYDLVKTLKANANGEEYISEKKNV